jgi:hypothetical protein
LYQDFTREKDFLDVLNYADDFGYVLWKSEQQKRLVLTVDGHEHVRSWLMSKSAKT